MSDFVCEKCRDSGMAPGNFFDPAIGAVIDCPGCWSRRVSGRAVVKANIFARYTEATFEDFDRNKEFLNQEEVVSKCFAYAEDWDKVKAGGLCLSILGLKPGMGKSHLASAICHKLIVERWKQSVADQDVCLFVNVNTWFGDWSRLYLSHPGEERYSDPEFLDRQKVLGQRESRMCTTELLVLDDVSKFDRERKKLEKLYGVIEHRVSHGLPIVVTENADSWGEVAERLGPEFGPVIVDRLCRSGDTVVIKVPLVRRGKKVAP